MKLSCNGCRILRKGCGEDCAIRPCLEWINTPQAQANATLFLAKFYGRAGLVNLIDSAPQHNGPAVFKSLLYEACGRIANPTFGSVGLFWTGEWAQCQAAVDAVLAGSQIKVVGASDSQGIATHGDEHVAQILGIRHVSKDAEMDHVKGRAKKIKRSRTVIKPKPQVSSIDSAAMLKLTWSREPGGSEGDSEETVEAMLVSQNKPSRNGGVEMDLDLTLG
ncbi:LOB domain-containing protein 41-like [Glycine soja]|uniref:LOB domain-containing protein 41 n=1 Tax=Glycine soja TaxID=3848 RepID=A0A445JKF6_GLYSO|nr:LOB domain-containing protein 41-like [Glycine soja]RZB98907.1 LOB domain-containing protein 41 [Glycine soja]